MEMEDNFIELNASRVLATMKELIQTPSVVGYFRPVHQLIERYARTLNLNVTYDNRHTTYIRIPGEKHNKVVCFGAHLDTIGLIVRAIDEDGTLHIRNLGGANFHSLEGETVKIHTRHGVDYTGTIICKSHSVHVFEDARSLERDFENMRILIDEEVSCKKDVQELGISPGDLISCDPRFIVTDAGYIKSRHIDDKASAAVLIECMRMLEENNITPTYDTLFAFPIYEEIGQGGTYIHHDVDEYIALDIGLTGGLQNGSEKQVSIAAADAKAPYDWDLTSELCELATLNEIDYVLDIYYKYGSDATAGFCAGRNIAHASFGPGCFSSHGYERTHLDAVMETLKLAFAAIAFRN